MVHALDIAYFGDLETCYSPTKSSFLHLPCGNISCDPPFLFCLDSTSVGFHSFCVYQKVWLSPLCVSKLPSAETLLLHIIALTPDPSTLPGSQLPVLSRYPILAEHDTLKVLDRDRDPLLQESETVPYCCRMHTQCKGMTRHFTGYSESDRPRVCITLCVLMCGRCGDPDTDACFHEIVLDIRLGPSYLPLSAVPASL